MAMKNIKFKDDGVIINFGKKLGTVKSRKITDLLLCKILKKMEEQTKIFKSIEYNTQKL